MWHPKPRLNTRSRTCPAQIYFGIGSGLQPRSKVSLLHGMTHWWKWTWETYSSIQRRLQKWLLPEPLKKKYMCQKYKYPHNPFQKFGCGKSMLQRKMSQKHCVKILLLPQLGSSLLNRIMSIFGNQELKRTCTCHRQWILVEFTEGDMKLTHIDGCHSTTCCCFNVTWFDDWIPLEQSWGDVYHWISVPKNEKTSTTPLQLTCDVYFQIEIPSPIVKQCILTVLLEKTQSTTESWSKAPTKAPPP